MNYLINIMKLIPKNLISLFVGLVTRIRWPILISGGINRTFIKIFSINMEEAEFPVSNYKTIEDVFTRKLAEGERKIESNVVSPSDGFLAISHATRGDRGIQAKGLFYSAEEMVFGLEGPLGREFDPAWTTTVYLAPHNYHRVHSPIEGKITDIIYHPGELWPVNNPFVKYVPNMFSRNERLVFAIEWKPDIFVYAVMVGALNVGRISTPFNTSFVSNSAKRQLGCGSKNIDIIGDRNIKAGDELGTFLLGSTVVLVFDRKFVEANKLKEASGHAQIKMGNTLLS